MKRALVMAALFASFIVGVAVGVRADGTQPPVPPIPLGPPMAATR